MIHHPLFIQKLIPFICQQRWYRNKSQQIVSANIIDNISLSDYSIVILSIFCEKEYLYVVPLQIVSKATEKRAEIFSITLEDKTYHVYDACNDTFFCKLLWEHIKENKSLQGNGELTFFALETIDSNYVEGVASTKEQSNTSIVYGNEWLLKLFRQPDYGINPDMEMNVFLSQNSFSNVPKTLGGITYKIAEQTLDIAILQQFVKDAEDCWEYTLSLANAYWQRLKECSFAPTTQILEKEEAHFVKILAKRTAELHICLGAEKDNSCFIPEKISREYLQNTYVKFKEIVEEVCEILNSKKDFSQNLKDKMEVLQASKTKVLQYFQKLISENVIACNIRCHGDYHLGQVLKTTQDIIILDFEGEPLRSLNERREKQSPFKDIAGMIRSFNYAIHKSLIDLMDNQNHNYSAHAESWALHVQNLFLQEYFQITQNQSFIPTNSQHQKTLLELFLLDKAFYELKYEYNNRPDWIHIPLNGIIILLKNID